MVKLLADAVSVGTLAGWATFAAVAGLGWALFRGGGSTALSTLEAANRVLEARVNALETQAKADQRTIVELRARTDVTEVMRPLLEALHEHNRDAQTRHANTLTVLDLIARRLGGETA